MLEKWLQKIDGLIEEVAKRLHSYEKDKYMHFAACTFIAWIVGKCLGLFIPTPIAVAGGFIIAVMAGVAKEGRDSHKQDDTFSWSDVMADVYGAAVGAVMSI